MFDQMLISIVVVDILVLKYQTIGIQNFEPVSCTTPVAWRMANIWVEYIWDLRLQKNNPFVEGHQQQKCRAPFY